MAMVLIYLNAFPPSNMPSEFDQNSTTIEYEQQQSNDTSSPAFLFVIDTSIPENELAAIKASIEQTLTLLPSDCLIGLITFGKHCSVHEIGYYDQRSSHAATNSTTTTTDHSSFMGPIGGINRSSPPIIHAYTYPYISDDASKGPLFDAIKLIVMNVHYHHGSAKMTPIDELHISPHINTIIEIKEDVTIDTNRKNQKETQIHQYQLIQNSVHIQQQHQKRI